MRNAKKELDYFYIGKEYGSNQDWFRDPMMKFGGCAAVTACDTCIYLSRTRGKHHLYPFHADNLSKADYIAFSKIMKPYLKPRWGGIDKLEIYQEGLGAYLKDAGEQNLRMELFSGEESADNAKLRLKKQIDAGFPVPCLMLKHKNRAYKDYVWHWFLLTGYESIENAESSFMVKAVNYGEWEWLDFDGLWDTGYARRGGLILFHDDSPE